MACRMGRKLYAYREKDLPARRMEQVQRHLTACADCRRELEWVRRVDGLLAEVTPVEAPPNLSARTMSRARQELSWPVRRAIRPAAYWAAGAAALATVCFLTVFLYTHQPSLPGPAPTSIAEQSRGEQPLIALAPRALLPSNAATAAARPILPGQPTRLARISREAMAGSRAESRAAPVAEVRPLPQSDAFVSRAYDKAALYAKSGDTDLQVAALENVALTYPRSAQAAKALLTAGDLERGRGNAAEADQAYRKVLALQAGPALPQALAHKALGDLRRETAGRDEVALYHYTQAAKALREVARKPRGAGRVQALVALGEVEKTLGDDHKAAQAFAEAANAGGAPAATEETTARLVDVL